MLLTDAHLINKMPGMRRMESKYRTERSPDLQKHKVQVSLCKFPDLKAGLWSEAWPVTAEGTQREKCTHRNTIFHLQLKQKSTSMGEDAAVSQHGD